MRTSGPGSKREPARFSWEAARSRPTANQNNIFRATFARTVQLGSEDSKRLKPDDEAVAKITSKRRSALAGILPGQKVRALLSNLYRL
jgi:hypothetical protein